METSQCEEPSYWRAKLLEIGIKEPKGNRYQLRALYRRTAPLALRAPCFDVLSEVISVLLRLGKVTNLDARSIACTSRRLRETIDASVDVLLKEVLSRFSRLNLVLPSRERLAVAIKTYLKEEIRFSLDPYAVVTFGRGGKSRISEVDVLLREDKAISLIHLVLRRKGLGWEIEVLGRNGVLFTPRGSQVEPLKVSTVRPIEVGDRVEVPKKDPTYVLQMVR